MREKEIKNKGTALTLYDVKASSSLAIGDTKAQFYYLLAYLSPSVKKPLVAFAASPRTPHELIEKLRLTYGDPNSIKRAAQELYQLR
ncbi:hypothetical protein QBC45DRAFT_443657 [Copromyces sp. CBS 386.78]|nr:hypothetical protein QBC45DRAFT_443657 [Copromyces sp. CBS 386.78]